MTPSENRILARSSLVLLIASGVRLGWSLGSGEPVMGGPTSDDLSRVAAETDSAIAMEQRRSRPLEPDERIDLNRADSLELQRLPRVGPAMASAIVAARTENGGLRTWADLDAVAGVGPATLERLKPRVEPLSAAPQGARAPPGGAPRSGPTRAGGGPNATLPTGVGGRVSINRADSTTLVSLPGIGPALAGRILAYRAHHGPFRRLEELMKVPGIGPARLERLRPLLTGGAIGT